MKLYHGTQEKFEKFDLGFSCDMGFHFAESTAQAKSRLAKTDEGNEWHILVCEVAINNPISLPDIGDWADHQLLAEALLDTQSDPKLREIAKQFISRPYSFIGRGPHFDMAAEMVAAGYDGIKYENVAEGYGTSYMAFSESQVRIVEVV